MRSSFAEEMKVVAIIHLLLIAVSSKLILGAFGFAGLLADFYRDDAIQAAGGYPEIGTIPFDRMMEGRLDHFLPFSISLTLIAIFPVALLLTVPRVIGLLINRPLVNIPRLITRTHLVVVIFGLLASVPLFIVTWFAAEEISISLGAFSIAHGTGTLILGSFVFSDNHLKTNREQGGASNGLKPVRWP
jgi:hypothetical protein